MELHFHRKSQRKPIHNDGHPHHQVLFVAKSDVQLNIVVIKRHRICYFFNILIVNKFLLVKEKHPLVIRPFRFNTARALFAHGQA